MAATHLLTLAAMSISTFHAHPGCTMRPTKLVPQPGMRLSGFLVISWGGAPSKVLTSSTELVECELMFALYMMLRKRTSIYTKEENHV